MSQHVKLNFNLKLSKTEKMDKMDKLDTSHIEAFLKEHVKIDGDTVDDDLKKNFAFGKRKRKRKANPKRTKKSKLMTRKEKNLLGVYRMPILGIKYADALPMNALWNDYMRRQFENAARPPSPHEKEWDNFSVALYKSDFHGAVVSVVDAKCESLKGLVGICLMETKNTLRLLARDDKVKTIPKPGSLFKIHTDRFDIMIYGKHIAKRPAERANKISKAFSLPQL